MPKVAAIVPMRHASERVPWKNHRLFAGEPLYAHILRTLACSAYVNEIVVDTDSPVIMEGIAERFPGVLVLERPLELRGGDVSMNAVLSHTVGRVDADLFLQTHCTNPLLTSATIDRAIDRLVRAMPENDSLFSVNRLQSRLWDNAFRPLNHDPAKLERTQDLPPIYEENSCIYLFTRDSLATRGNRIGERPIVFEMSAVESLDIDEELDFRVAEVVFLETHRPVTT